MTRLLSASIYTGICLSFKQTCVFYSPVKILLNNVMAHQKIVFKNRVRFIFNVSFLFILWCFDFSKHICGTSIASISPRSPNEGKIDQPVVAETAEKRKRFIDEWRQNHSPNKRCIIVFRDDKNLSDHCHIDHVEGEKTFFHSPREQFGKLTFSGYEQDHVLIVLEAVDCSSFLDQLIQNGHATNLDDHPDAKLFGQILLNATTRAKKTLNFIVLDIPAKGKLMKMVSDRKTLIVAPDYDNPLTPWRRKCEIERDYGTVLRVALHREDYESLKEAFAYSVFATSDVAAQLKTFNEYVLPGCAGREKSGNFLDNLTKLLEEYELADKLNNANSDGESKTMKEWYQSAYSRGLVRVVDWRIKHGVPQGTPENLKNLKSLYSAVLLEAIANGSERVVRHAFIEAPKFILKCGKDLQLDELGELTDLKHKLGKPNDKKDDKKGEKPESLLSLVAKTNKDPKVMRFLVGRIKNDAKFKPDSAEVENSVKQSLKWSVKYHAFEMIEAMTEQNENQKFKELCEEARQQLDAESQRLFDEKRREYIEWKSQN